jgi:hypothetical protein
MAETSHPVRIRHGRLRPHISNEEMMLRVLKKRGRLRLRVAFSIRDLDGKEWTLRSSSVMVRNLGSQGSLLGLVEKVKEVLKG